MQSRMGPPDQHLGGINQDVFRQYEGLRRALKAGGKHFQERRGQESAWPQARLLRPRPFTQHLVQGRKLLPVVHHILVNQNGLLEDKVPSISNLSNELHVPFPPLSGTIRSAQERSGPSWARPRQSARIAQYRERESMS